MENKVNAIPPKKNTIVKTILTKSGSLRAVFKISKTAPKSPVVASKRSSRRMSMKDFSDLSFSQVLDSFEFPSDFNWIQCVDELFGFLKQQSQNNLATVNFKNSMNMKAVKLLLQRPSTSATNASYWSSCSADEAVSLLLFCIRQIPGGIFKNIDWKLLLQTEGK